MDILSLYSNIWELIDGTLFLLAATLFFLGVLFAPIVVKKEIRLMLWYPLWIWRVIKRYIKPGAPFFRLWALIFLINSISLFCNLVSGLCIILPTIFSFLLGAHIVIVSLKEVGRLGVVPLILNPVSLFELPAAWISLSLGMSLARELYLKGYANVFYLFQRELMGYFFLVLPLLAIAGFIEVALIKTMGKRQITGSGFKEGNGQA